LPRGSRHAIEAAAVRAPLSRGARGTGAERKIFFRSVSAAFTLLCYPNSNAAISPTPAAAFSSSDDR
jgi:hypothetical protein